jgi:hypothetical protein
VKVEEKRKEKREKGNTSYYVFVGGIRSGVEYGVEARL